MTGPDVEVLRADTGAGVDAWLAAWERCGREPFAHPAYVQLFARGRDEMACCVVVHERDAMALLPLVVRPVPAPLRGPGPALLDAVSPYGYGGPFSSKECPPELWRSFLGWLTNEHMVSAFLRLALGASGPADASGVETTMTGHNIIVDLSRTTAQQWDHYDRKVRKNVNRARRSGLRVTISPRFRDLAEFVSLYRGTMQRRSADSFYHFDETFFATLQNDLAGGFLAVEVRDASDRLVSAEVVLASDRFLYSYLGGTAEDAFPSRPNDLLKHELIDHGRETGRDGFVLGGGYLPDDGIFRYKRSFDPQGEVEFQTVRVVSDPASYARLTATHLLEHPGARFDSGYFPEYRAPLATEVSGTGKHDD